MFKEELEGLGKIASFLERAIELGFGPGEIKRKGKVLLDLNKREFKQKHEQLKIIRKNPELYNDEMMLKLLASTHISSYERKNITSITNQAIEFLEFEEIDNNNLPSDDWIYNFYDNSKGISEEEIQTIWAKILAEEIKNPNQVSIITLDTLKKIDKRTAKILQKVLPLSDRATLFFNVSASFNFLPYLELVELQDRGLISFAATTFSDTVLNYTVVEFDDNSVYQLIGTKPKFSMQVLKTTTQFEELKSILKIKPNKKNIAELISYWKSINIKVFKLYKDSKGRYKILSQL